MADRKGVMWGATPMWVICRKDLSKTELRVYCVLQCRQNRKTGRCFPSHETIAKDLNIHVSKVRPALKSLREKRLIYWRRRGHPGSKISNEYTLAYARPFKETEIITDEHLPHLGQTPTGMRSSSPTGMRYANTEDNTEEKHSEETTSLTVCASGNAPNSEDDRNYIAAAIAYSNAQARENVYGAEDFKRLWKMHKAQPFELTGDPEVDRWELLLE